jgi:CheY-like chemotaxis protein
MSKIVLHVDDSATMQMVADITFRGTEYQCVGARSVDEALEKAKAQRPTLVLADAQMPGKTGYDLCLAIKSDPKLADVPVVILCGNAQAFDAAKGTQVGADGTLPKPWDSQVMLEKVTEAVEKASKGVAKPGGASPAAAAPTPAPATPAMPATPVAAVAAAAANAKGVPQPPRSATIMGMPTIKMPPAGNAAAVPVTSATPPAAVAPAAAATPPPVRGPAAPLRAPAAAAASAPASLGPATPAAAVSTPAVLSSVPAAAAAAAAPARPPMVSATPTKRSALVERTLAKMAARLAEASGLEPGSPELLALLKLSTEVVERVVWEVVPELAEQIIRENLEQLAAARRN